MNGLQKIALVVCLAATGSIAGYAQTPVVWWHNQPRQMHYQPEGKDFVTVNGKARFNRALYGTHTAFRVEAGDLPEFALYLPGMGGNLRLGILTPGQSKWLIQAQHIKAVYRPGSMLYEVKDSLLGNAQLNIGVWALAGAEGMVVRVHTVGTVPQGTRFCWLYGGVTGKKFSRDGDIGADPESSFYLQPAYCTGNRLALQKNHFRLAYGPGVIASEAERYEIQYDHSRKDPAGTRAKIKWLEGAFSGNAVLKLVDAAVQSAPAATWASGASATPAVAATVALEKEQTLYALIRQPGSAANETWPDMAAACRDAEAARMRLAQRVELNTPDPYLNTLGGALSTAADAIWEAPSFLHGAVAWRMRLNAWRGPYAADPLGWHDRARMHFDSYALSQLTTPETGPVVADTALHLARQLEKLGTSLFSSGYICRNPNGDFRPHHYDMNLVFIDALLRHLSWTGDTAYVKKIWPLLRRHLAWEKRNFDADNDGLYDAYCCIWASDALQYSGGGVTHASAYNYFANRYAAELAVLIGEDAALYRAEADKIARAVQQQLWLPAGGWLAEYRDAEGARLQHPAAALWTIYHAIDSKLPDPFQAYQCLQYIDQAIPHIPVKASGWADTSGYLLSTTNWQPYTWSINNVALAEELHTALAYWQGNRPAEAFRLWKTAMVETMYMSASPGGFEQLSFYDAMRGELYRDFADPIGVAARSLVEGLFGIVPDALHDSLLIKPGFPEQWSYASLHLPDIRFDFRRNNQTDEYLIEPAFTKALHLRLQLPAHAAQLQTVTVNGQPVAWQPLEQVGAPAVVIHLPKASRYRVRLQWKQAPIETAPLYKKEIAREDVCVAEWKQATVLQVFDPQKILREPVLQAKQVKAVVTGEAGAHSFFVRLKQGVFTWWQAVPVSITQRVTFTAAEPAGRRLAFRLHNHTAAVVDGTVTINPGNNVFTVPVHLPPGPSADIIEVPEELSVSGSNAILFRSTQGWRDDTVLVHWTTRPQQTETVDIHTLFNDRLTRLFSKRYTSPRPQTPTLQLPVQGIGNWCYPLVQPLIDDTGLRRKAGQQQAITLPQGIRFATPGDSLQQNTAFVSRWDVYPDSVTLPLSGNARHAYFLMAGTTNPMQSRLVNGIIRIRYTDGSVQELALRNPDNWCPVEQDYYRDDYAFRIDAPPVLRYYLKEGVTGFSYHRYSTIKGFTGLAVEGGAANVLDMPLDNSKELQSVTIQAVANDVIIGLLSLSLLRQ